MIPGFIDCTEHCMHKVLWIITLAAFGPIKSFTTKAFDFWTALHLLDLAVSFSV